MKTGAREETNSFGNVGIESSERLKSVSYYHNSVGIIHTVPAF
jgi:hypothetical protein